MDYNIPEIKKLGGAVKYETGIDVPVLMLFFNRVYQTEKVFEQIKIARPSVLFLYQDGARENVPEDKINVQKCRDIVEDIDWECKVYRQYCEKNQGCDPSEYLSQRWAFDNVDRCIILEDDDVPSQSFFPYCKELLEKYKDDDRIGMICGTNRFDTEGQGEDSYFFNKFGWAWGWATWRRFYDLVPDNYDHLDDPDFHAKVKEYFYRDDTKDAHYHGWIKRNNLCRASGRLHYEMLTGYPSFYKRQCFIIPKHNMITNIGIISGKYTEGAHNSSVLEKLPRRERINFTTERYELEFPLSHPDKVELTTTLNKSTKITKFQYFCDRIESLYLKIKFGDFKGVKHAILRRIFPNQYI